MVRPKHRRLFRRVAREGLEVIPQPHIKPLGHGRAIFAQPFRQRGFHRIQKPGAKLGIRRMRVRQAFEIPRLARLMDPVDFRASHRARGVAIDMRDRGPLVRVGAEERFARLARVFEFLRRP